jgi:hypothetical protein
LLVFQHFDLPAEFYSSFAGALAALIFSALITYYVWQKSKKISKDTKAQIIQTLLSEIELNLNNVANFVQGCKEGSHVMPFVNASIHRNSFWPKFLIDYPHSSFELSHRRRGVPGKGAGGSCIFPPARPLSLSWPGPGCGH